MEPLARRLALALLVCATLLGYGLHNDRHAKALPAQSGNAVRYIGALKIGTLPAPSGTTITAVVSQTPPATTVCGSGTAGANGSYEVDIQPIGGVCVRQTASDITPDIIFLVNGENVGERRDGALLNVPASLNQAVDPNLQGTYIPGLNQSNAPDTTTLFAERFYGVLTLAGAPAPAGTEIDAAVADGTSCGTGVTTTDQGDYYVDIRAIGGECLRNAAGDPIPTLLFGVNGEQVGALPSGALLNVPTGLAKTVQHPLQGQQPPQAQTPIACTPAPPSPDQFYQQAHTHQFAASDPLLSNPFQIKSVTIADNGKSVVVKGTVDDNFRMSDTVILSVTQGGFTGVSAGDQVTFATPNDRSFVITARLCDTGSYVFTPGVAKINTDITRSDGADYSFDGAVTIKAPN